MNRSVRLLLAFSPFLFLAAKAHATTVINDVHSSANGGNATSNVTITNGSNTNGNSTSSYTTTGNTNIHVESNGQSYDYQSDKPGSVSVKSVNGKVTVNGEEKATTPTSVQSDTTASETAQQQIDDAKKRMEDAKKKAEEHTAAVQKQLAEQKAKQETFIQKLIDSLKSFFHLQ